MPRCRYEDHSRRAKVLLVRSNYIGWDGIQATLEAEPGVDLAAVARHANEAAPLARIHRPDAVLLTAEVVGGSSLDAIEELHADNPAIKVIVVGRQQDPETIAALARAGAAGYLGWPTIRPGVLLRALDAVLQADLHVSSREVIDRLTAEFSGQRTERVPDIHLGECARAVLRGLAMGLTEREIAREANASLPTVERVIADLKRKLDAPTLFVLGMRAQQMGLAEPSIGVFPPSY